ncbi:PTS lactose/cellobiose transporter subunit IIA [Enterococcus sp. C76]|uniref:PTS lactose/cellobiose transporter subunit IIA n=1 Tax=Enterococcus sp. C76 TaxID=3231334 RepID=UPI00349FEAC5
MEELETKIFDLIVHSGNARGLLFETLECAENKEYYEIDNLLNKAKEEMNIAHNIQTQLIQDNLAGKGEISLLLIHAQDQLMTVMSEQALIERLIKMQKQINENN